MSTHAPTTVPRLLRAYLVTTALYFLFMLALWMLGVESIYGHPTPFYALYKPVFNTMAVPLIVLGLILVLYCFHQRWLCREKAPGLRRSLAVAALLAGGMGYAFWQDAQQPAEPVFQSFVQDLLLVLPHLPPLLVFSVGLFAFHYCFRKRDWVEWTPSPRERRRFLWSVFAFLVLFSSAVAMMRGGLEGISQAYARESYEYIGDIGKASSIRALFTRWVEMHEYLSMHSKVHPPGPVALLWLLSYVAGQSPFALSVATILFGSLGVFPLYGWARGVFGEAQARTTVLLYALVPSIVLFTATSADVLFVPFTLSALWLFDRALQRNSVRDAALAGMLYGVMSVLSFSLIGLGAYFGFTGLWYCLRRRIGVVVKVAVIMGAVVLAFHGLLYMGAEAQAEGNGEEGGAEEEGRTQEKKEEPKQETAKKEEPKKDAGKKLPP